MKSIAENVVGIAQIKNNKDFERSPYIHKKEVTQLIREALCNAGLGKTDPEAPLKDIISEGMTVLLKPNWVLHFNKSNLGMDCMITNHSFIEAIVAEVAKAKPAKIIVADAPIQSAEFILLAPDEYQQRLTKIAQPSALEVRDLRNTICRQKGLILCTEKNPMRNTDSSILFDLGHDSLVEPLSNMSLSFRNTSYASDTLSHAHQTGRHQYRICREVFESDVIINLPKLKAHRKAGLTAALKNLVGVNGDKDYLPHHRVGGSDEGGDCYEGKYLLKRLTEKILDNANRNINKPNYFIWRTIISMLMRLSRIVYHEADVEGAWYGNDTIWRMILDLNRIVLYGKRDGTLSGTKQRNVYSLTDAIIGGEGFGPLAPEPKYMGVVTFAFSSAYADLVHAELMGFDWNKIPQIKNAFSSFRYPLVEKQLKPTDILLKNAGKSYSLEGIEAAFGTKIKPPVGWITHIEKTKQQ